MKENVLILQLRDTWLSCRQERSEWKPLHSSHVYIFEAKQQSLTRAKRTSIYRYNISYKEQETIFWALHLLIRWSSTYLHCFALLFKILWFPKLNVAFKYILWRRLGLINFMVSVSRWTPSRHAPRSRKFDPLPSSHLCLAVHRISSHRLQWVIVHEHFEIQHTVNIIFSHYRWKTFILYWM